MTHLISIIIPVQKAGYEMPALIVLIVLWGLYRYYQFAKNSRMPGEPEDDEINLPDYDIPEAKAVFREPFLNDEITIYNSRGSDPFSANLTDTFADVDANQQDNLTELMDFDAKKAVVWAEIIKRPYC